MEQIKFIATMWRIDGEHDVWFRYLGTDFFYKIYFLSLSTSLSLFVLSIFCLRYLPSAFISLSIAISHFLLPLFLSLFFNCLVTIYSVPPSPCLAFPQNTTGKPHPQMMLILNYLSMLRSFRLPVCVGELM